LLFDQIEDEPSQTKDNKEVNLK